jgi:hypothetical protein
MAKMDTRLIGLGLVAEGDVELLGRLCETLARHNVTRVKLGDRLELQIQPSAPAPQPIPQAAPERPEDHDLYAASGMVPLDLRKVRGV